MNYVGVDVNTASPALLRYVSGLNQLTARRVYEYRREHGPFRSREQLREVPGFGEATFVQAAGFLKIAGGDNPLDATWIHPESYPVADKVMEHFQCKAADLADKEAAAALAERMAAVKLDELAKHVAESLAKQVAEKPALREQEYPLFPDEPPADRETASEVPAVAEAAPEAHTSQAEALAGAPSQPDASARDDSGGDAQATATSAAPREPSIGTLTLRDILAQLARPGRDPREDLPPPVFKQGIIKLEDLAPGMELTGTVLNVVDFGCFVDIGMHDSGLVHVSRLADRFIRDPHEVVAVGDVVHVWVMEVDKERRRVSLTMVRPGSERPRRPPRGEGGADQAPAEDGQRRRAAAIARRARVKTAAAAVPRASKARRKASSKAIVRHRAGGRKVPDRRAQHPKAAGPIKAAALRQPARKAAPADMVPADKATATAAVLPPADRATRTVVRAAPASSNPSPARSRLLPRR